MQVSILDNVSAAGAHLRPMRWWWCLLARSLAAASSASSSLTLLPCVSSSLLWRSISPALLPRAYVSNLLQGFSAWSAHNSRAAHLPIGGLRCRWGPQVESFSFVTYIVITPG